MSPQDLSKNDHDEQRGDHARRVRERVGDDWVGRIAERPVTVEGFHNSGKRRSVCEYAGEQARALGASETQQLGGYDDLDRSDEHQQPDSEDPPKPGCSQRVNECGPAREAERVEEQCESELEEQLRKLKLLVDG